VEEPPEYAYFIFTAKHKDVFLPTILSRVTGIPVLPCEKHHTEQALRELKIPDEGIAFFPGNIGKCIQFVKDKKFRESVMLACEITDALRHNDEYTVLKCFNKVTGDRFAFKFVLGLLRDILRDAAVGCASNCISCCPEGALALGKHIPPAVCADIYTKIEKNLKYIDANVNMKLLCSGLGFAQTRT
ncbi:MAG: hypothetical protein LBR54_05220, partial [Oscillospiraceae bacterium]|nr:hypothetical protein [Oscillospiraceae bacterium]